MAAQRKGFASHLHRQAKAKKIQTILEQALGRSLDGLRVLDVGTDRGTLAHRDGWHAPVGRISRKRIRQSPQPHRPRQPRGCAALTGPTTHSQRLARTRRPDKPKAHPAIPAQGFAAVRRRGCHVVMQKQLPGAPSPFPIRITRKLSTRARHRNRLRDKLSENAHRRELPQTPCA